MKVWRLNILFHKQVGSALKFLGVVHHNKMHIQNESANLYLLIGCHDNCKNTMFLFSSQPPFTVITFFLEIKSHKGSFPHWPRALGIGIRTKVFKNDRSFKFSLYSIILHKNLFHAIYDWKLNFENFPFFLKFCLKTPYQGNSRLCQLIPNLYIYIYILYIYILYIYIYILLICIYI